MLGHVNDLQIRMQLPYGTMSDDEIRSLRLHHLQQTDGVLFLWVTGRCVELGRQLIEAWGYRQVRRGSNGLAS